MLIPDSAEKAFKSKARHFGSILGLRRTIAQELFSRVLGYSDYFAARRAGHVMPELESTEQLTARISKIIEGISSEKIDELVKQLNLRTVDSVIGELGTNRKVSADFSRFFASDGAFSQYYHDCLSEIAPVFLKVHDLSLTIAEADRPGASIGDVVAGLRALSREDAQTAKQLLTPVYKAYPDLLPVATAMLVLHAAENKRSTRILSKNVLEVLKGMLEHAVKLGNDVGVRAELQRYGHMIAQVQRSMGAHEASLDVLCRLAEQYRNRSHHLDISEHSLLTQEAAFAALFAGRFNMVVELLSCGMGQQFRRSPPAMAIRAIAKAQLGDSAGASELFDILLCDNSVRLALGFDPDRPIPRRRPEIMPLGLDILELQDRTNLDKLRYVDMAAFSSACALFNRREQRMQETTSSSELLFKRVQFFPDLRFAAAPGKRKSSVRFPTAQPAVLQFGPAPCSSGAPDFYVVVLVESNFGFSRWIVPPGFDEEFEGNAYFRTDPAKGRWLTHILWSDGMSALKNETRLDHAEVRLGSGKTLMGYADGSESRALTGHLAKKPGLGLARRYAGRSIDWSWDEVCFELFLEMERAGHADNKNKSEATSLAADLATQLTAVFRQPIGDYLASRGVK
jgi:hypothetical protein